MKLLLAFGCLLLILAGLFDLPSYRAGVGKIAALRRRAPAARRAGRRG